MLPNALALLGVLYQPGVHKNLAFSFFGGWAPSGAVVGAVFAGVFNLAWWPWTFWSSAIVLLAIAVTCSLIIPDPPTKHAISSRSVSAYEVLKKCDALGAVVGIVALALFNFAWNQAPIAGWGSAYIIITLILGILLIPMFFYIEMNISSDPIIPFAALDFDTACVLACIACGWSSFGIWIYYLWQQLEVLRGVSPLLASAYSVPLIFSGLAAGFTSGLLLQRIGPAMLMTVAMLCFLVSTILIATAPVHQNYWAQIFMTAIVAPWGMDMSFPAATIILSNSVSKEHQGVAASLVNTFVDYSISIGLGFASTVETNVVKGDGSPEDLLRWYRGAWYLGIGLSGLGVATSLLYVVVGR